MKYNVFLLLSAVALVRADRNNQVCTVNNSEGVLIAHEACNKFYVCNSGRLIVFQCPDDLLFNTQKSICDWPDNVVCGNRLPEEVGIEDGNNNSGGGNSDPSQAATICAGEGSDGVLVAHEECNKFYKCSEGVPVALSCPGGLLYAPQKEQCDWPENVKCENKVVPDDNNNGNGNGNDNGNNNGGGGNSDSSQAATICAAEDSDGILVAHEECDKFYKCSEGVPVALSCPGGLLYAPQKEQCDWPENVKCENKVVPDDNNNGNGNDNGNNNSGGGNSDPSQAATICAAEGSDGILVAHEECNKFYKCSEGVPVALSCPGGLLYAPQKEQCDWPENVKCENKVVPDDNNNGNGNGNDNGNNNGGGGNSDPSQAATICAAEGSDGILVAHEECDKFYKCSEGVPVALSCPGGLLYAPQKGQCDWPENVKCENKVVPDDNNNGNGNGNDNGNNNGGGGNSDPSEAAAICAAEGSDGTLVAHEECDKFYKCSEGVPVALSCPDGLLYAPQKEQCDWPENVKCENKVVPDDNNNGNGNDNGNNNSGGGNSDPSQAATICAAEGSDGILVAHEECNKFYKCSEGVPVALSCPGGLLYAPQKEQCDWPENVKCENKVVPDDNNNGNGNGNDNGNNNGGGGNSDPSQAATICAAEGSDGTLVAHEECDKFYKCSEGVPVALSCPDGLLYAPQKEQCDWPENVKCENKVVPDDNNNGNGNVNGNNNGGGGNSDPSQAATICAAEGSDGVLVAHEECNKFYKCSEEVPVALSCPGGLLYAPQKEQCDWPENVNCGNRLVPTAVKFYHII